MLECTCNINRSKFLNNMLHHVRASLVDKMVKNLSASAGDERDTGSLPWFGRTPGEENGKPIWYSCLENSMDRGVWQTRVHGVTKIQKGVSD